MISLISRISAGVNRRIQQYKERMILKGTVGERLPSIYLDTIDLLRIVKEQDPSINVIFDVGGHIGKWSLLAKSLFPKAQIHVFEPLLIHVEEIKKNLKEIDGIHIYNYGLGANEANATINLSDSTDSSSLLPLTKNMYTIFGQKKTGEELVAIKQIDSLIYRNEIPVPDVLKLDVQGYEIEVLKGAINNLKRIKYIIMEVSFVEFYRKQPLFDDTLIFMKQNDFQLYAFGKNTLTGKPILQTDILFKNIL